MMDMSAFATAILSIPVIFITLISQILVSPNVRLAKRTLSMSRYCGPFTALFINLFSRGKWCIQAEILQNNDDDLAKDFRKNYQDECNMTSVTGALVASVATAGLGLDSISETHWTARAFFVSSIVFSLASVFTASKVFNIVGRLFQPAQINAFIGVDIDIVLGNASSSTMDAFLTSVLPFRFAIPNEAKASRSTRLPSPSSCLLLSFPYLLLTGSLVTYVFGLGIYLGYLMVLGLTNENSSNDSRNVFIFFIVIAVVSYLSFEEAASILSGSIAGRQDSGDRIMDSLDVRRTSMLKSLNIETSAEYKKWRNNCIRESRKKRILQTRLAPDIAKEESAVSQESHSEKNPDTHTKQEIQDGSQDSQSKSGHEQEIVSMLREASKLLEQIAVKMGDKA